MIQMRAHTALSDDRSGPNFHGRVCESSEPVDELLWHEGLAQNALEIEAQTLFFKRVASESRHEQDLGVRPVDAGEAGHLDTVDPTQDQVGQDYVELMPLAEPLYRLFSR